MVQYSVFSYIPLYSRTFRTSYPIYSCTLYSLVLGCIPMYIIRLYCLALPLILCIPLHSHVSPDSLVYPASLHNPLQSPLIHIPIWPCILVIPIYTLYPFVFPSIPVHSHVYPYHSNVFELIVVIPMLPLHSLLCIPCISMNSPVFPYLFMHSYVHIFPSIPVHSPVFQYILLYSHLLLSIPCISYAFPSINFYVFSQHFFVFSSIMCLSPFIPMYSS